MSIAEICSREVVYVRRDETVRTAARLMRETHAGSVVVVDEIGTRRMPAGILTDRDVTVAVVAMGLDPESVTAGEVMSGELITVREGAGIAETAELMRRKGVRRLPVTDAGGALAGIVAADDLLSLLSGELAALAGMVKREARREADSRRKSA